MQNARMPTQNAQMSKAACSNVNVLVLPNTIQDWYWLPFYLFYFVLFYFILFVRCLMSPEQENFRLQNSAALIGGPFLRTFTSLRRRRQRQIPNDVKRTLVSSNARMPNAQMSNARMPNAQMPNAQMLECQTTNFISNANANAHSICVVDSYVCAIKMLNAKCLYAPNAQMPNKTSFANANANSKHPFLSSNAQMPKAHCQMSKKVQMPNKNKCCKSQCQCQCQC